jgi:hypothetical protein
MKIEQGTATKLTIADAPGHADPIHVFLEDLGKDTGRAVIATFHYAWVGLWGGMSGRTIAQFLEQESASYVARYLAREPRMEFDSEALRAQAKTRIEERARDGELNAEDALSLQKLFAEHTIENPATEPAVEKVFGPEWWRYMPERPTAEYAYLQSAVAAIQAALKQIREAQATPA